MVLLFVFLSWFGCRSDLPVEEILPACGNGIVEPDEQCDDGADNSDSRADACRTQCRVAQCGDGVVDSAEACDDGNLWGGDGCGLTCGLEEGALDTEPNDSWDAAQDLGLGEVTGSLSGGDVDCYAFDVAECHTIAVSETGDCSVPLRLSLHAPDGSMVAVSGMDASGCAAIDPVEEPGARFASEGQWAVCAAALLDREVMSYTLSVQSGESIDFELPLSDSQDFDGDGLIDECDGDRDGDGLDNAEDNCPDIPNGPSNISPTVDSAGFVRHWMTLGPFDGEQSAKTCLPTDVERLGDDASAEPVYGDVVDGRTWQLFISDSAHVNFIDEYATVDAPREVYAITWVHTPQARDVTLGLGPDDGARVWLNGEVVQEVASCQGVVVDKFTEEVTLDEGWNRLLVKVYDQGGGWGTYLRFLEEGLPVTGLELSLSSSGAWDFDQTDSDGDGIGDVCDDD